jgi:hypothetical protein
MGILNEAHYWLITIQYELGKTKGNIQQKKEVEFLQIVLGKEEISEG